MTSTIHTPLKRWLITLGAKQEVSWYRSLSGDKEPLTVQIGKRIITFQPDVIWERAGSTIIFDLALNDGLRSIVGEITLAALSRKVAKVLIVTDYEDKKISTAVSMLSTLYERSKELKWGADHISVKNLSDAKKKIYTYLNKGDWVW